MNLGMSPLCQTQIKPQDLNNMEQFFPLHAFVCEDCLLVQLAEYVAPEVIFDDQYPYFSSFSESWVAHAKKYVEYISERLNLSKDSFVVELASNDGYLLQHFVENGVPVLGVEPTENTAIAAREKGVPTECLFFGEEVAKQISEQYQKADLILGNNVLAHVPDLNDFVEGIKQLLAESGTVTIEFPHLLQLIKNNQFDTIYHEHFSYFSLLAVEKVFKNHGLRIFDVQELKSHGGSIRIFACHDASSQETLPSIANLLEVERQAGLFDANSYTRYGQQVEETKRKLLSFLIKLKNEGKTIVGYGAPGKGNTLLNYCGIREDFLDYTVDRSPHKYGTHTPGTHIPIFHPDKIKETKPDYVLILPWNLSREISEQMSYIREWGGKFIVPIPEVKEI